MPDFRIVSENFKELNQLEVMLREIAQKKNNEIRKNKSDFGVEYDIIQPKTRSVVSFSIYNKDEFEDTFKFHNNLYGNIIQINWSSKMPIDDIDNFMIPLIKELREYLPYVLVISGDDYITIDEFLKKEE